MRALAREVVVLVGIALVGAMSGCCKNEGGESGGGCKLGALEECGKECDGGKLESCMTLGRSYQMGEPKEFLRDKALATFVKACDKAHGPACIALAKMVDNPAYERTHNPAKAAEFLKKACDGGIEDACVSLALRSFSTAADKEKAFKDLDERCKKGKARSCTELAWMYRSGHHVPDDDAKAAAMFKEGCDKGEWMACNQLAASHNNGWGVPTDLAKAQELWTKACENGLSNACCDQSLSLTRSDSCPKVDPKKAFELRKKACSMFSELGCALLASDYASGVEGVVGKDSNLAIRHYQQSCMLGFESACADATKLIQETSGK